MNLTDDDFLRRFEACTLDPGRFDHRAHLRVAWLYLGRQPLSPAIASTCRGIRRFAGNAGAPDKFHHTITEFLVRTIDRRMKTTPVTDFDAFVDDNRDLLDDALGLVHRCYSRSLIQSEEARVRWVEPDLAHHP